MGKYAILLHGQPRYCEHCIQKIKENILDVNKECDIYGFFWRSKNFDITQVLDCDAKLHQEKISNFKTLVEKEDDFLDNIKKHINFKNIIVEDQILFEPFKVKNTHTVDGQKWASHNVQSHLYAIKKSFDMMNASGVVYDGIFKIRLDIHCPNKIDLDALHRQGTSKGSSKFLFIRNLGNYVIDSYIFVDYNTAKELFSVYDKIESIFRLMREGCNFMQLEAHFYNHITKNCNVNITSTDFFGNQRSRQICFGWLKGKCDYGDRS